MVTPRFRHGLIREMARRAPLLGGMSVALAAIALALYTLPDWPDAWLKGLLAGSTVLLAAAWWRERRKPLLRRHRVRAAGLLAFFGLGALAFSAYYFRPMPDSLVHYRGTAGPQLYVRDEALIYLAASIPAIGWALLLSSRRLPLAWPVRAAWPSRWVGWWHSALALIGIVLLGVVAEANGQVLTVTALEGMAAWQQLVLLVAGLAAVTIGLGGIGWPRGWRGWPWREIGLLAALTLVALGVRLWQLDVSLRKLIDESHYMLGVMHVWDRDDVRLLQPMPTTASFPYLYAYFEAGTVELFGRSLAGLRGASAIMGALTVPAVYALARGLIDRRAAWLAALALTTFPPHVHFSRLALNNIADPLFATAGLAGLAWGLRSNRRAAYALGGVCLGLSSYFYEGGRLLFPALAFGWLIGGWLVWRPRPAWQGIALALLAFVIVAAPVYYTLVGVEFPVTDRMDKTELASDEYWQRDREPDNLATRLTHLRQSLLLYVGSPENTFVFYYIYYGGDHPLIQEWAVPAFLLGVLAALWRWRTPVVLLVLWVVATSIGNALLIESAVTARYVVVFPALAILIGLGIRQGLPLIWPGHVPSRALDRLMIGVGLALAVGQGAYYFGPHLDELNREVRESRPFDGEDALLRVRGFPAGTQVYILAERVISELDAQRIADFVADDVTVHVMNANEINVAFLRGLSREQDLAFFVRDRDAMQTLARAFGHTVFAGSPHADVPPDKQFYLYYVPAAPGTVTPIEVGQLRSPRRN